ncbi:hypothetical protein BD311DRAFT_753907 [Dichomitus squalens]|uniref:Uncharacterized protein n=1 Tax=Dichomitus squalens TaxID=114155 RepID=A0A4Q9MSI4_9APHY|nr:hypothetical protein BD311DRAFT_753907 [Dichomitus squalens]
MPRLSLQPSEALARSRCCSIGRRDAPLSCGVIRSGRRLLAGGTPDTAQGGCNFWLQHPGVEAAVRI